MHRPNNVPPPIDRLTNMMRESSPPAPLTAEQRLLAFYDASIPTCKVLSLPDAEIEYSLLRRYGCRFPHLVSALTVAGMHARGFRTPEHYRDVGMDALDLHDVAWARELVQLFGRDAVVATFVRNAEDAMLVAGAEACHLLGLTTALLLEHCSNQPRAAEDILRSWGPMDTIMPHLTVDMLLKTGLTDTELLRLGLTIPVLIETLGASTKQLSQLGFGSRIVRPTLRIGRAGNAGTLGWG